MPIIPVNYRMADVVAQLALKQLKKADALLAQRKDCAAMYADVVKYCDWLVPQKAPGSHDYWTYAVSCEPVHLREPLVEAIVRNGGERPYAAWRLSYREPALLHGARCPTAERLQSRLIQFATNNRLSAERNAAALLAAISEVA